MRLCTDISAVLVLVLAGSVSAWTDKSIQSGANAKPDFSGVWKPDPAKMTRKATPKTGQKDLPPPPPPDEDEDSGAPTITIRHQDLKMSITTASPDGEDVSILNLTTDGQENTNPVDEGNTYNKSKSHWDGARLITEWTIQQYGQAIARGTDTRYLGEDGKTMIVDQRIDTDEAVIELHQVFVRADK